ncbi:MAG: bifunctional diguanylate cyclase/phosphohydrolase [Thermoleophilia bacterium]
MGTAAEFALVGASISAFILWARDRAPANGRASDGISHAFESALLPTALVLGIGAWRLLARLTAGQMWSPAPETLAAVTLITIVAVLGSFRRERSSSTVDHHAEGATDPLTRVASHRAFQDRLTHECDRAYRFGDCFALALLDLDQFQSVNNRHHHRTGDRILFELAGRVRAAIRDIDLCARFGGDQFAVILPHTLHKGGVDAAERLRQVVATGTFLTPDDTELRLTATVGVAYYPADATTPPELVEAAKRALLFAKSLGGNQIQLARDVPKPERRAGNVVELSASSHTTVVRSLAAAVDVRDRYTHSHSQLVSELAAATARRVGLPEAGVERVKVGALLHDVGKIGVPDAVLAKEGSLTAEDWDSIRAHPVLGKTIIEQAPELKDVVPLVLHHQERFDGSGYPSHLRGESIPLGARIIAAADAYHAIRSDRPYRSGRTHSEAITELRRCAGSQFDPIVVGAFVDLLESDDSVCTLLATLDPVNESQPYTGRTPFVRAAGL